jgi:D-alanyl-D-alanine carboxypeptidase/D-alanyl-D-alanine-endopeptidase (penicillin-binding protein 4)
MRPFLLIALILLPSFAFSQTEQDRAIDGVHELLNASEAFSKSFTGFMLYDPKAKTVLVEKAADKYFTPASNAKILTLYTSLKVLGDSIPAFRYATRGDSLILWGTANPMFLHPLLPQDTSYKRLLLDSTCALFFSGHNFKDRRFGPGWAWDDYNYNFQVERSSFPIYGNLAYFVRSRLSSGFQAYPRYFQNRLVFNPNLSNGRPRITRREKGNVFEYNDRALSGSAFYQEVPFNTSAELVAALLSDTLGQSVEVLDLRQQPPMPVTTHKVPFPDTLLRLMMKESDNFIAEQLLLACAEKLTGTQRTEDAIRYAQDSLFQNLTDPLIWRDGSGLSRYNLFTPRAMVEVLALLHASMPEERLLEFFAAGGVSGTLKRYYAGRRKPYVFAKTGTLSNKHCLSGYLRTDSGRLLIFSFMHNNYVFGTIPLKNDMEVVLEYIRDRF